MTLLIYLDTLSGGGVERVCLDYDRQLRSSGHDVYIIPRDGKISMPIATDCSVDTCYNFRSDPKQEISRLVGGESDFSQIIIMAHMRKSASYLAQHIEQLTGLGCRCSLFIHASLAFSHGITTDSPWKTLKFKHFLEFWRLPKIFRKSRERLSELRHIEQYGPVICVSEEIASECRSFGLESVIVLENGIDFERIQRLADEKPQIELPSSYIVHIARLSKEKRQEMLLKAYAKSKSSLKLVLVGAGPLRSKLEALAAELNISQSVVFTGYLENPYPLIAHAHFSIICSEYEGFGLSIAESLGLGIPVLMTDRPYGIRNVLLDYDTSLICEDNEDALADRIQQLSQTALPTFCEMSIVERLDLKVVVDHFLKSFGSV